MRRPAQAGPGGAGRGAGQGWGLAPFFALASVRACQAPSSSHACFPAKAGMASQKCEFESPWGHQTKTWRYVDSASFFLLPVLRLIRLLIHRRNLPPPLCLITPRYIRWFILSIPTTP